MFEKSSKRLLEALKEIHSMKKCSRASRSLQPKTQTGGKQEDACS